MHGCKMAGLLVATATVCFVSVEIARAEVVLQTLHEFFPTNAGPAFPATRMTEGNDGNFYGTTTDGGLDNKGTVFKITPAGAVTTLFSFNGTNGNFSIGGLMLGSDGNFYGTTAGGGTFGHGTVFSITTNAVFASLFSFGGTNGAGPRGPLAQASDGSFYRITDQGGTNGLGTVFRMMTNGVLITEFDFNGTNAANPQSGLTQGSDGNFYGTTQFGGSNFTGAFTGNGTVFKITTNGVLTTLVYFNGTNGSRPSASLALGSDQNFYGTTRSGTVFKVTTNGEFATLVTFNGTNGFAPFGGVTQGRDGNFYGTTAYRTENSVFTNGTVFKLTANGVLTTLVYLDGTNGLHPFTDLMLGRDGNLYGAMSDAEKRLSLDGNAGTIFRLVEPPVISSITRSNGSVMLSWPSFTNGIYRAEYKPSLAATNWTALVPNVTATSNTASFTDSPEEAADRYYRIVLLP